MRAFTPLVSLAVLTAATILPAGLVSAGDLAQTSIRTNARPVLICATDAATRRAFTREHGSAPIFVAAREALSVRSSDPAWSSLSCRSLREHARYRDAATTYAAVR